MRISDCSSDVCSSDLHANCQCARHHTALIAVMVACSHYLPAGLASAWHPDGAVRDPFGDICEHDGVAVPAGAATGVSLHLFTVSGPEQRLAVRSHVEHDRTSAVSGQSVSVLSDTGDRRSI